MKSLFSIVFMFALLLNSQKIQAQVLTNDQVEKYFENLSDEERNVYLQEAEVLNSKWIPDVQSKDVLKEFEETCKAPYPRDFKGIAVIPKVTCDYKPATSDDPMDGSTPKFKCVFDINGKKKSQKIKYSFKDVDPKELQPAVFVASVARLLGFHSNTYCPAVVVCKGCPQDPWLSKSQEPAVPGAEVTFANTVVEFKVKGDKLSRTRTMGDKKPLGFDWGEMRKGTREQLIAREALMVFINLVNHGDADPHNHRLVCQKWEERNGKPVCLEVAAFTHDWGDAFDKMSYSSYSSYQAFSGSCVGRVRIKDWYIGKTLEYSKEAVDFLLDRLDRVSDQQMIDLLNLAKMHKTGNSAEKWVSQIRQKANHLRSLKCKSIDTGKTALGKYIGQN